MSDRATFVAYAATNLTALLMLWAAWRRPVIGRALFFLLFVWAAQLNLRIAWQRPDEYVGFADYARLELYRNFITGFFARHVTAVVSAIAVGQLAIAVLVALRGPWVRAGLLGSVVFFLAIAPLGAGSAFPATLTMAVAAGLLLRREHERTLPRAIGELLRRLRRPPHLADA